MYGFLWSVRHFSFGYSETECDKKELKFANLTFTVQVRHVFQVLRGVISEFYVLFPGSMLNHRPVWTLFLKTSDITFVMSVSSSDKTV